MNASKFDREDSAFIEKMAEAVRDVWVEWASTQSNPKPSWLVPWKDIDEISRDADRWIARRMVSILTTSNPDPIIWCPEVVAFADAMEAQLRANDHKPGWKNDWSKDLLKRLREETDELEKTLEEPDYTGNILKEAADVANFAMMIADVCGGLNKV